MPDPFARATLSLPQAVVGNVKTELRIGHQVQVGMKGQRVTGMTDDSVPVSCFLVELCRHAIHVIAHCELASMH